MTEYVVIGSGVIGLYTTFLLLEKGIHPANVSVIAEYHPGDQSINYASPYAGAYFSACIGESLLKYSEFTYENIHRVQQSLGKESGVDSVPSTEYLDERPSSGYLKIISGFLEDFETIQDPEVPDAKFGVKYKAWVFNSPLFIGNLKSYLEKAGVRFERKILDHIKQAFGKSTKVVFNCSGNGSITMGGVEDPKCYPTRGQVVVVNAPHVKECVSMWGDDSTYIIKRPHSKTDEVILGGFYQEKNLDANTYGFETDDILQRTTQLYPHLLEANPYGKTLGDLRILRVVAGARPSRAGGPRIELEKHEYGTVIHNYGAGGCGYLCGLGMSNDAVELLEKVCK
ncbi:D-aspartate oxidase [Scheffersomyces xylosifermentans]|uniref:D-aspartate oxidase n=1 Tax=Scheffersomyces xylosifermentans TaxID=1304137 RepID=UPI00315DC4A0